MKNCYSRPLLLLAGIAVLFAAGLTATAHADSEKRTQQPRLGQEFDLRVGERAVFRKTNLTVKFDAVKEDSRCPSDVTCVWAGNARVELQVTNGRKTKSLTLNSNTAAPLPADSTFAGYSVKLVNLNPYPLSKRPVARGSYVVRLFVSRN